MSSEPSNRTVDQAMRRPTVAMVLLYACLCAALVGGDQWLKSWAFTHLPDRPASVAGAPVSQDASADASPILIPHVLGLKLVANRGAVFGIGQGHTWLFLLITVVAIVVIAGMFARTGRRDWFARVLFTLILAGAVGNFIDRAMYGAVRDMLWLFPDGHLPFGWHWPRFLGGSDELYPWLFNLADVYLVVGIGTFVIRTLLVGDKTAKADDSSSPSPR